MKGDDPKPPVLDGGWEAAERLRRWAFLQRTPEQRLAWLVEMLEIAYQTGAIRYRGPGARDSASGKRAGHRGRGALTHSSGRGRRSG